MAVKRHIVPIVDEFTRADGPLGVNWTVVKGSPAVSSNQLGLKKGEKTIAYWNAQKLPSGGHESFFRILAVPGAGGTTFLQGVMVHWNPATKKGYAGLIYGEFNWEIIRIDSETAFTILAKGSAAAKWKAKDLIGLESVGSELRLWREGATSNVLVATVKDETAGLFNAEGYAGVYGEPDAVGTYALFDDFGAGILVNITKPEDQSNSTGEPVNVKVKSEGATEYEATGLPPGISITGEGLNGFNFTGEATSGAGSPYTVKITIKAPNLGTAKTEFKWTIAAPTAPSWSAKPADRTDTAGGGPIAFNVAATSGTKPITYTMENAPSGVVIDAEAGEEGEISGTPAPTAVKTVTIKATNAAGTASTTFKWTVNSGPPPVITKPANQNTRQGKYAELVVVSEEAVSFTATGLPPGLILNTKNGGISGIPETTVGSPFTIKLTATNLSGSDTKEFTWTVKPALPPLITPIADQTGHEGDSVSIQVEAEETYRYEATGLPPGVEIDEVSGLISGKLGFAGVTNVVVKVTGYGGTETEPFKWTILGSTIVPSGPQIGAVYTLTGPDGTQAVFNDSTDPSFVGYISEASGLDSPEVRENAENLTGLDGGIHGSFFYGRRQITLSGIIPNVHSPKDRNQKMTKLLHACNAMRADATLEWTPEGGEAQFLNVRRAQPVRITGNWVKEFQVPLVAADPRIYSTLVQTAATTGETLSVENRGDHNTYPVISIEGEPAAMTLENETTKEKFSFNFLGSASANNYWYGLQNVQAVIAGTVLVAVRFIPVFGSTALVASVITTEKATLKAEYGINPAAGEAFVALSTAELTSTEVVIVTASSNGKGRFWSLNITNGATSEMFSFTGYPFGAVKGSGSSYFWSDLVTKCIGRRPTAGSPEPSWTSVAKTPRGLAIQGGNLYWGYSGATGIGKMTEAAGSKNEAFIATTSPVLDVTADSTYIYWTMENNKIGRALLAGTSVNNEYSETALFPAHITNNGLQVYWANQNSWSIGRLLKYGSAYTLDFDFRNRSVTSASENLYRIVNAASEWFPLEPGVNNIKITYANKAGEAAKTTFEWRNAWI
jgi:hypothetical protein